MIYDAFISYASVDVDVATELQRLLEAQGLKVWRDARELTAGDALAAAIQEAIAHAQHFIVVLSPRTVNSRWVLKEVQHAQQLSKERVTGSADPAPKLIPLLLNGIEPSALEWLLGTEPLALQHRLGPGGFDTLLPSLLAALGRRAPTGASIPESVKPEQVADLVLKLQEPTLHQEDGKRRARAKAVLEYHPASGAEPVVSAPFFFTAPLGPIEAEELSWYLERFWRWPVGVFRERADRVETALPRWGQALYEAAFEHKVTAEVLNAWKLLAPGVERRFSVEVDEAVLESSDEAVALAKEAATALLSLPWELSHDARGFLFQGKHGVRVRRRLPNRFYKPALTTEPPLRVLLVSPRPEDERAGYIDHRVSAQPVVEALNRLGGLAQLTLLQPPTFDALQAELLHAEEVERPYHVVHFDGHGVFDQRRSDKVHGRLGLGALVFEDPSDSKKLEKRKSKIVDATKLAELMRDRRVPLFFLEACQSAQAEKDPTASVAGSLLQEGVASVVAMSHSVLVETARRFASTFYPSLLSGDRVGKAMLKGQQALWADKQRGRVFSGELELHDWFVPVLFQEHADPQLITHVHGKTVQAELEKARELSLGKLPAPPPHSFVGRSRALLAAERHLCQSGPSAPRYWVLRGEGGEGKTALACELARWLISSRRFQRTAFVSLEHHGHARTILHQLGEQLVPDFTSLAAQNEQQASQYLDRALEDAPTLLVLDNLESVLAPPSGAVVNTSEPEVIQAILDLCQRLSKLGGTRLLFTSREQLPEPFRQHEWPLGRLDQHEAIALVSRVLGEGKLMPRAASDVESETQIEDLVEAVGCHARSLVLVARELRDRDIAHTTETLRQIMTDLHQRYPDDRERSLFASVELSLRRLPPEVRAKLGPLGVFQGGGVLPVIAHVLELEVSNLVKEVTELAQHLVQVGLAEMLPYGYLRLDPALGPALLRELNSDEEERARAAWVESMVQLTEYLYQERFKNVQLAATLTLLDLPNLLAALEYWYQQANGELNVVGAFKVAPNLVSPEAFVNMATRFEALLQPLGRPKALARVVELRRKSGASVGSWGNALFQSASTDIDRLLDSGHAEQAVTAAQQLLECALAEGEAAYPGAVYDIATAYFVLGRSLRMSGNAGAALGPLGQARQCFQALANAGGEDAAGMASVSLTETANCLRDLGQLDAAAEVYQETIQLAEARGATHSVAVGKAQLGTVWMLQQRYADALGAYEEARTTFGQLGEPAMVATAWHQIGMVHSDAQHYETAERAYQESLRIQVQLGNRSGEAGTLVELGNLYSAMRRFENAVSFYRQAADIYASSALNDRAHEGLARSNAANALTQLGRHAEARQEILRTIECDRPFGHAAEPWKTFAILSNLERASGDAQAATKARIDAMEAYVAWRRDGAQSMQPGAQLCAMLEQALRQNEREELRSMFEQLANHSEQPAYLKPLLPALFAILNGSRDPALAEDPNLDYDDAAELMLLLERLG